MQNITHETVTTLSELRNSIFNLWFQELPDNILILAIQEIEKNLEMNQIQSQCPNLYPRYLMLRLVVFLSGFLESGQSFKLELSPELDSEGNQIETSFITFKAIYDNGSYSLVKSDSITTTGVKREYTLVNPAPDSGNSAQRRFPAGYLDSEIDNIEKVCFGSAMIMGGSSRIAQNRCGGSSSYIQPRNGKYCRR